jgi:hypothetical protein
MVKVSAVLLVGEADQSLKFIRAPLRKSTLRGQYGAREQSCLWVMVCTDAEKGETGKVRECSGYKAFSSVHT